MSRRRDRQAEHKQLKKFLEPSKDSLKRLRSLNQGLDKSTDEEIKSFYTEHSSAVFYCVYTSFTIVEANIHDRVVKGKGYSEIFIKDLIELVLPALQRVLEFLPELIHRKWQFNSICTIVRKLFHPQNGLKIRKYALKLLVLWIQALQENAGDACMELFASAIPHFPPNKTPLGLPTDSLDTPTFSAGGLCERYGVYSSSSVSADNGGLIPKSNSIGAAMKDVVHVGMIYPLSSPSSLDKDNLTLELMENLLKCLTSQLFSLHWDDPSNFVRGFSFLFFLFKLFYLAPLYKEFRAKAGLYTQPPPPTIHSSEGNGDNEEGLQTLPENPSQESHVLSTPPLSRRKHGRTSPYRMSSVIKLEYNTSHPIYAKIQNLILHSILKWVLPSNGGQRSSTTLESSPSSSPLFPRRISFPLTGVELMREMWFTNRDNVNLLLEICRVGFQTPLSEATTLKKLIELYFHWEQTAQKPPFMNPAPVQSYGETTPSTPPLLGISDHSHSAPSRLSILSWEQLSCYEGFVATTVQAGPQSSLRMIVCHTCQVFLKKAEKREELDSQIEMCRKILRLYQEIAMTGDMDHDTWEYSLAVLLHLTVRLLAGPPPTNRNSTLGGTLAELLLRTLLIYYLRASMATKVSPHLWDDLLTVVSSLTRWKEVITEWQFVMSSMTSVLAQTVYGLNLLDLPLSKLDKGDHNSRAASRRSATSKEIPSSRRLDSFSTINILTVSSIRLTQRRDTADGQLRLRNLKKKTPHIKHSGKSNTEEAGNNPNLELSHLRKKHSLPSTLSEVQMATGAPQLCVVPENREDGSSPESLEPMPMRSVTTSTLVSLGNYVSEEKQDLLVPQGVPSPGALSLPAEFILESSEVVDDSSEHCRQLEQLKEERKGSMFVNLDTSSPSPDSVVSKNKNFFSSEQRNSKNSKSRKPPAPDLVLTNENVSDSEQESRKSLRSHRSSSENPNVDSPLVISTVMEATDSDIFENRRLATIRKSSSEGNIHRIILCPDMDPKPTEIEGSNSSHVIRRVLSSSINENENVGAGVGESFSHASSSPSMSPPATSKEFHPPLPQSPPKPQGEWTAESVALIWQRMLKVLGDINKIQDPGIHSEAMGCLENTWRSLVDMSANLGIPIGSSPTPPLPEYVPPLSVFFPWVIKACSLPQRYLGGRIKAHKMLCRMVIRHWHTLPSQAQLAHFYRLMHSAFQPNSDILRVAVKYGFKLFSHCLPGSSILLRDSIIAIDSVLSSSSKGSLPRNEALHFLGTLLCLPDHYPNVPVLGEGVEMCGHDVEVCEREGVKGVELKEQILSLLYRSAKTEPLRNTRCLAVFQVGLLVFTELRAGRESLRLTEGVDILLASLHFSDRAVSMAAVDMLSMLVEVAPCILSLYHSLPARILQALCYAIAVFLSEEVEGSSWLDKLVVTLILCLRDWLVALPIPLMVSEGALDNSTLKSVFEVLQVAAGSIELSKQVFTVRNPVTLTLAPMDHSQGRSPRGEHSGRVSKDRTTPTPHKNANSVQLSSYRLTNLVDKVQIAARSVITHLLNLLGHFPFSCGSAQMSSVVREYHDSPTFQHMHELSTEIFDSPRVQFFSFNNTAIVTLVEIPTQLSGVPSEVKTANYQTRVIVRDVSGKYSWDSAVLYGPEKTPSQDDHHPSLTSSETAESLMDYLSLISQSTPVPDSPSLPSDPLQPPSWRTHNNSSRDVLEDLLVHIETTSPECVLFPGTSGLCEAVPVGSGVGVRNEGVRGTEEEMLLLLNHQHFNEQRYVNETKHMQSMQGECAAIPKFFPSSLPFHHCRLFLSHLGMLSWEKRNHLDLLEKSKQLILELKHLDNVQAQTSRQTYKVAVLYVAPGQEDKSSIFSNSRGSRKYEEFLAGLGWEVEMETHSGYMGGLKREFCANCTLPYYATSSEEVLFHVATRLPLKIDQKVRHLGNDFVHVVWSEHWRDYRRSTFRTQFGDVIIIIYPQPNGLFRVQIDINSERKANVSQFGPLFDGALVPRDSLPSLVRATAINGLRALRSSLIGSRGRYEERLQNIHKITKMKLMSSFEEFSESVMHPLEMSSAQPTMSSRRASPTKIVSSQMSFPSIAHHHKSHSHSPSPHMSHHHKDHKGSSPSPHLFSSQNSHSPKTFSSSFLRIPTLKDRVVDRFSPPHRHRASTNDDRMQASPKFKGIRRNSSVPDLSEIGKLSASDSKSISDSKKLSDSTKLRTVN